ncbi:MAG: carbohydrate ABC transporter substrate-binding protein [Chloroflexi bacterium]|nr:carbohydrate ABC transporter substrate-binding protein [Chloroflexota bacterium]
MKTNRREFLKLSALATAGVLLAACTQSTSPTAAPKTDGDGSDAAPAGASPWDVNKKDKIVLSVINNYYTAGWKKMAADYMALHPETEVVVDVVADNDTYLQKMTTWLTGDDFSQSADIVHINFAASPVGGYQVMYQKDMIYDFRKMLDEPNPYNDNKKVRDCFTPEDLPLVTVAEGQYALPFDWVGIAIMYNKTLLDKEGIALPKTYEEFDAACAKLRKGGMAAPIAAASEAAWYISSFADAALRSREYDFLVQPEDGLWDEATMAANRDFVFDENDWTCDRYTVISGERVCMHKRETKLTDPTTVKIWEQFANIGKYFQENFTAASSMEIQSSFELSKAAFFMSGSWNVGVLNSDIKEMGDDGFEWGTMSFPPYANAPEGFQAGMRTLYVVGNTMGIIKSQGDGDHLERVKDFYKFCYNPKNAQDIFETTLNAGNYVQGPPSILGVKLSDELNQKLEGFVQKGAIKDAFGGIAGQDAYLAADKGVYVQNLNDLLAGKIDAKAFCENCSPIFMAQNDDIIEKNGYDLDPATADKAKE